MESKQVKSFQSVSISWTSLRLRFGYSELISIHVLNFTFDIPFLKNLRHQFSLHSSRRTYIIHTYLRNK